MRRQFWSPSSNALDCQKTRGIPKSGFITPSGTGSNGNLDSILDSRNAFGSFPSIMESTPPTDSHRRWMVSHTSRIHIHTHIDRSFFPSTGGSTIILGTGPRRSISPPWRYWHPTRLRRATCHPTQASQRHGFWPRRWRRFCQPRGYQ